MPKKLSNHPDQQDPSNLPDDSPPPPPSLFADPESFNVNALTPEHIAALKTALEADRANPSNPDDFDDSDELDEAEDSDDSDELDDDSDELTDDELATLHPAPTSPPNQKSTIINPQLPDPQPEWSNAVLDAQIQKRVRDRFRAIPAWGGNITPLNFYPWIVQDIAQSGHITLLVGDSAAKKTYTMLHLAVHVAFGLPWLGHPILQSPVLYMDEDHGNLALNHRITLLTRGLRLAGPPPIHIASHNFWNFPDEEDAALLEQLVKSIGARLLIFDPLFQLAPTALESSVQRMHYTLHLLRQVAESAKTAIILVHHLNKRGLYRGVSHLQNLVDAMFLVHSRPNSPHVYFDNLKLRNSSARSFAARMVVNPPGPAPYYVEFHPHAHPSFQNQTVGLNQASLGRPLPPARLTAPEALLRHLAINGPATRSDIIAALPHHKPDALYKALTRLHKSEEITLTVGAPGIYAIASKKDENGQSGT